LDPLGIHVSGSSHTIGSKIDN